jgi:hypothetical protein
MAAGGIYDVWIERSLARLAERMPGRYAKFEASSGALTSLDHYAYQPPGRPAGPPSPGGAAPEAEESPLDEPVPAKAAPSAEVVDSRASVESVPTLESAEQAPPKEAAMPGEVDADAP